MKRFALVLGGAALLACSEDPALYFGGPPGAPAALSLSHQALTVIVGDSAAVGANVVDAAGNITSAAPTITSCAGGVVAVGSATGSTHHTTSAWIRGAALGSGCLVVSSGSFTDSITVNTGPAGIVIAGPDTVGSGEAAAYTVSVVDVAGNTLTGTTAYDWTANNSARLRVDHASGDVRGKATGAVTLRVVAPGGANATKSLLVEPGTFGGTLSASTGNPGVVITVDRAADGEIFDADAQVRFGTVDAFVDAFTPDQIIFAIPATGTAGATEAAFRNLGPGQVEQRAPFTISKATEDTYAPGNTDATVTPPAGAPEASAVMTALNNIYLAHGGFGTLDSARGAWNGGSRVDHYVKVTTGASDVEVTITLSWANGSDVDLFILDDTGAELDNSFSGSTTQEVMTFTFPANSTSYIGMSMWSAGTNVTNLKLNLNGL